jgi:hypothetical protein
MGDCLIILCRPRVKLEPANALQIGFKSSFFLIFIVGSKFYSGHRSRCKHEKRQTL